MSKILLELLLINNYGVIGHNYYENESNDKEICEICLGDIIGKSVLEFPCGDKFHQKCILDNLYESSILSCPNLTCSKPLIYTKLVHKQKIPKKTPNISKKHRNKYGHHNYHNIYGNRNWYNNKNIYNHNHLNDFA